MVGKRARERISTCTGGQEAKKLVLSLSFERLWVDVTQPSLLNIYDLTRWSGGWHVDIHGEM